MAKRRCTSMAMLNRPDLLEVLLEAGADPTAEFANSPQSPLDVSAEHAELDREAHSELMARADKFMAEYPLPTDEFWKKFPRLQYSIRMSYQEYSNRAVLERYLRSSINEQKGI